MRGGQNNRVPILAAPTVLGVAYAFWKDLTAPFTIALMIGQVPPILLETPCVGSGFVLCRPPAGVQVQRPEACPKGPGSSGCQCAVSATMPLIHQACNMQLLPLTQSEQCPLADRGEWHQVRRVCQRLCLSGV